MAAQKKAEVAPSHEEGAAKAAKSKLVGEAGPETLTMPEGSGTVIEKPAKKAPKVRSGGWVVGDKGWEPEEG